MALVSAITLLGLALAKGVYSKPIAIDGSIYYERPESWPTATSIETQPTANASVPCNSTTSIDGKGPVSIQTLPNPPLPIVTLGEPLTRPPGFPTDVVYTGQPVNTLIDPLTRPSGYPTDVLYTGQASNTLIDPVTRPSGYPTDVVYTGEPPIATLIEPVTRPNEPIETGCPGPIYITVTVTAGEIPTGHGPAIPDTTTWDYWPNPTTTLGENEGSDTTTWDYWPNPTTTTLGGAEITSCTEVYPPPVTTISGPHGPWGPSNITMNGTTEYYPTPTTTSIKGPTVISGVVYDDWSWMTSTSATDDTRGSVPTFGYEKPVTSATDDTRGPVPTFDSEIPVTSATDDTRGPIPTWYTITDGPIPTFLPDGSLPVGDGATIAPNGLCVGRSCD